MSHHGPTMRDLPSGTVTLLFTDVEGSTALLRELGAERYAEALMEHRRVLRDAFSAHGGVEVDMPVGWVERLTDPVVARLWDRTGAAGAP